MMARLVFVLAFFPSLAHAQTTPIESSFDGPSDTAERACEEGRVRLEGRCCWPGQHFSLERARCEGAPTCPIGLIEHGDGCVAPALSALPAPGEVGSDEYVPSGYGDGREDGPDRDVAGWLTMAELEERPTLTVQQVRGEDEALIAVAFAIFDVGWLLGLLVTFGEEAAGGACRDFSGGGRQSCGSWPFAFIPVVGGMIAGAANLADGWRDSGWGIGFGIPSIILQNIGLVAIGIAFGNATTEYGYRPLPDVELTAGPAGSEVGAGVAVRF